MNEEQQRLVMTTLRSVLDTVIMSSIWQMPLWLRLAAGADAFAVLLYVLR